METLANQFLCGPAPQEREANGLSINKGTKFLIAHSYTFINTALFPQHFSQSYMGAAYSAAAVKLQEIL